MPLSDLASAFCTKSVKMWGEVKDANQMGRRTTLREMADLIYKLQIDLLGIEKAKGDTLATTFILAVVGIGKMIIASIGDSRVYVCQNGRCSKVTKDQTAAEWEKSKGISYDLDEEEKKSTLTEWLGSGKEEGEPLPKYYEIELEEDTAVLLCTDGLYHKLTKEEIYEAAFGSSDIESSLEDLIETVIERGETDNISGVLYRRRP
jgi:protein phosphatase